MLAALFCVAALAGCGPEPQTTFGPAGSAAVNLKITMPQNVAAVAPPATGLWAKVQRWVWGSDAWAASAGEITGLVVRVTGPGIGTPIASPQVPVSGAVSGLVIPVTLEVPVGADRVFAVAALDAANRPIFQGQSAPVTLVADQPATVSIQLTDTTIRIITTTLPDGTEDRSYTASLEAERGTGLTWTVPEGELPPGVKLDAATGALLGTSTTAGLYPITIRVTDALGLFDEAPVTIRINPAPLPPTITTTTLPNGTVGALYRATLEATGGTGAPTWSRIAGALPDGLNLNSATGVITGTPTQAGSSTFTVRATDSTPLSDEQVLTITINPAPVPPTITTTTLPDGTTGAKYTAQVKATGGTGVVTWNVVAGKLPDDLFLNRTTGALTGTPTKNGTFTFTIRATDTIPLSDDQALTITIKEAPKPPVITSTILPGGKVGDAYSTTLTATSTNGAVTWKLISAGPPAPGLQLVGATITGTPTTKGTFDFTVLATDGKGLVDEQPLFIQITDTPKPPLITTTTLPVGTVNVAYQAKLTATGGTGAITWSVVPPGAPAPGLRVEGAAIVGTPTTPGTFSVRVRATDTTPLSSEKVLTLSIQEPIRPPEITTDSLPDGQVGEVYKAQLTATSTNGAVIWSASGLPKDLKVDQTSGAITGTPTAAGDFPVTVRATDAKNRTDEETLKIQIRGNPPVIITKALPSGRVGEVYKAQLEATQPNGVVTWSASGLPKGLQVERTSGVITGTPSEVGTFTVTVRATDPKNRIDEQPLSLQILGNPPVITTTDLPGGTVGASYSARINATGGIGVRTWSLAGGTLPPPGLGFDSIIDSTGASAGVIAGTPKTAGTYIFTVRVSDASGSSDDQVFSVTIAPRLTITTTNLPEGFVNNVYSDFQLGASGGAGNYTWRIVDGGLPDGLMLSSGGLISGTPTTSFGCGQSFSATYEVRDENGAIATLTLPIFIGQNC